MDYPERFANLPEYAFPRLRRLLDAHAPGGEPIAMSIGEPRHPMPPFVGEVLAANLAEFGKYPANDGTPELLSTISGWLARRFKAQVSEDRIMALNGTREGLFNAAVALCPEVKNGKRPVVLIPNPFYQVYAIAAATVGAEAVFVPVTEENGFLPDFESLPAEVLDRTAIAYLCTPGNPQGAVAPRDYLARLLALAEKHDFKIFSDECYSEIWRIAPPPGMLEVVQDTGADPERVVVFHSLSKRSNLPGLRSGFCASGPSNIKEIRQLRAYSGSPLPQPIQRVSERVWADETHVEENRALYMQKYADVAEIFSGVNSFRLPDGGFFLWLPVDDGEAAALKIWRETGVRVLPGAYLAREVNGQNPGKNYIRVALVAPREETQRGLIKLRDCLHK
ncbi:aspartate/methionine/tyrosine aminotransferase [Rhodobacter aestuarii]|uniref:Aspartate/methionine/tyrosine aminotransferase n=1 Tax=Rhodobacter aestuarii TaxID=453582 RepID=A0A1N7K9X6_9RHOB|nr:aminotransferase class I/II-fold pyridoxal phosphate-dependent enzyme [Rhodobacter aestuarii]PTV95794.1 aspartate/methionine/tyrosine aminotransferase [Rhodobacter aestuarii]SIS58381.1 Aspartate/methionine/tyrosine aminotransferase [Rhodobacter aestuarii]